jgi:oligoendopeptidase F
MNVRTTGLFALPVFETTLEKTAQNDSDTLGDLPQWDLDDLYPGMTCEALVQDFDTSDEEAQNFHKRYKGRLEELIKSAGGGGKIASAIKDFEALQERLGRIISYAGLLHAGDTVDPEISKFYSDIRDRMTQISTNLLFFSLELNRIDDKDFATALENAELKYYEPWLIELRKQRPYQLDDEIERLFHEKSVTGRASWSRLFNETINDLRFEVEGEKEPLPIERTLNILLESNGIRRKQASDALAATFKQNTRIFALITNTLAKDREISDQWRGFEDVADSRHLANSVEREVVNALEGAVQDAYPRISHRYYALKAKWMGTETLMHWDRNAPLPERDDRKVTWDEARDTVLSAYGGFSPQMSDIAAQFFDKSWIDAQLRPGKSPGAFSHGTVPSVHPYVLMNYQGSPRDVMTLAHELGHGVHQVLAGKQGALMASTPLTLAETASVFGEMLTFRSMLAETKDPALRKALLAQKVEDMINTVVRQIAFYSFERRVHTERRTGEVTVERLGEIWMEIQAESLGSAVTCGEGYENFWVYIPHFIHSPFYVYAYAFGDCLVNSLYAVYEEAPDGFVEKYFDMLKAGGSKHHSELLKPFGLDASDPDFWSRGLGVIERLIDELETL